jgi:hypothetical protein
VSRLTLFQGLLLNLEGKIRPGRREYLPKEEARKRLVALTGQDFGYDVKAWRAWLRKQDRP